MEEEFRIIKEFPNYSVSSFGRIKNNNTGRILKPDISKNGYFAVRLCKDGKTKHKVIHRIVGEVFITNYNNKQCIDHINNNKLDNNVSNLRWVTQQENLMNMKLNSNNTSKYKGVCYSKQLNKWKAYIHFNRKIINLGYFNSIEDAINVRVKKSKELFGEYMNSCEKEINININISENTKVNLNINIKSREEQELEDLENEFNEILNTK